MHDITDQILNDLAILRMAATHRDDTDEVSRIDEDIAETRDLLGRPAVRVFHGAQPGEFH